MEKCTTCNTMVTELFSGACATCLVCPACNQGVKGIIPIEEPDLVWFRCLKCLYHGELLKRS